MSRFVALLFPLATLAVQFSGPYCGDGEIPNSDDCIAAMGIIDAGTSYTSPQLIEAGDCSLKVDASSIGTPVGFTGQEWLDELNSIVSTRCGFFQGWDIPSGGGNFSAYQCRTGGGFGVPDGPCAVATPTFLPSRKRSEPEERRAAAPRPSMERLQPRKAALTKSRSLHGSVSEPAKLRTRDLGPAEGYICDGALAIDGSSCTAIGDNLRGSSWALPFTAGDANGCYFAAEVKVVFSVGATMDGDDIADIISAGVDACASQGEVSDITYNPGPDIAYTMFFGNLCGGFGDGIGECGNGVGGDGGGGGE